MSRAIPAEKFHQIDTHLNIDAFGTSSFFGVQGNVDCC